MASKRRKEELIQIDDQGKYCFNPITKDYVFYSQVAGKNVVISETTLKNVMVAYSEVYGEPATIDQVSRQLKWPVPLTKEFLNLFQIFHSSLPITPWELKNSTDDEIIEDAGVQRKFRLAQEFEKSSWKEIQKKAIKWDQFKFKIVDPLESFLSTWKPPVLKDLAARKVKNGDNIFLCGGNDWHIFELTDERKVFSGKKYDTETSLKSIRNYLSQIEERITNSNIGFKECVFVANGDIVHAAVDNFTRRGTQLECEFVNEEAFEIALNIIIEFIARLDVLFKKIRVVSTVGNHDSFIASMLMMAAKKYFEKNKNISFEIEKNWITGKWFNNVYALISHGAHDTTKGVVVPRSGPKLNNFIQNHLLEKSQEVAGAGQKIVILGHLHSFYNEDLGSFDVYRFGTTVSSDSYGQKLGYFNKPRQNCLIVGKNQVEQVWHFYL